MHVPGGRTGGATPVPIPNTEVKPSKADATAAVRQWESRTLPGYNKGPLVERSAGLFFLNAAVATTFQDQKEETRAAGPVAANSPTVLASPHGVGSPAAGERAFGATRNGSKFTHPLRTDARCHRLWIAALGRILAI